MAKKRKSRRLQNATPDGHARHALCPKHALFGTYRRCDDDIWGRILDTYDRRNVFVNIPYTETYRQRRHYIISFLIHLGLRPVLASDEVREEPLRLCKLCELVQRCMYCLHDISEVKVHNVPMELGSSITLGRRPIVITGNEKYREHGELGKTKAVDEQVSNLRGIDSITYYDRGQPKDFIRKLLKRWTSPDLRHLLPVQLPEEGTKEHEGLVQSIMKGKGVVDRLFNKHGNYETVVRLMSELGEAMSVLPTPKELHVTPQPRGKARRKTGKRARRGGRKLN